LLNGREILTERLVGTERRGGQRRDGGRPAQRRPGADRRLEVAASQRFRAMPV